MAYQLATEDRDHARRDDKRTPAGKRAAKAETVARKAQRAAKYAGATK